MTLLRLIATIERFLFSAIWLGRQDSES